MRSPIRVLGAVVIAATALAGCSGGEPPKATSTPEPTPTKQVLDLSGVPKAPAPLAFDPAAAHVIPTGLAKVPTIALNGQAAWLAHASGMTMYDLTTGKTVRELEASNTPTYDVPAPDKLSQKQADLLGSRLPLPEAAEIGGEPAMITVVPVTIKDGRQAGFEVLAARASDGKLIWRRSVDIYGEPAGKLGALLASVSDDAIAVQWTEDGYLRGTFAVALDEPRVLWQRPDFWMIGGYDGSLFGFREQSEDNYVMSGVRSKDGGDLWTKDIPAGATWSGRESGGPLAKLEDDSNQAQLFEVATGKVVLPKRGGPAKRMYCDRGEGGTVMLCESKQDGAFAVSDAGKMLWRKPAAEWNATAEADFRDLAYAKGKDGPFVLDVRTGERVGADPGIVPDRVNAYAALIFTGKGTEVHLAKR